MMQRINMEALQTIDVINRSTDRETFGEQSDTEVIDGENDHAVM
jgi:hypothetical protein